MIVINIPEDKKLYFASDQHLGAPTPKASFMREKKFVNWLNAIKKDASGIFLLGDLFDFWFEYKTVVPKGFVRVLGKLAELTDNGIPVYFFVGNHDLWMKDYFKKELGVMVFHKPQVFKLNNTICFIGHGDGLGPNDKWYKRMKKVFTFPLFQCMFSWLHPDLGLALGQHLSVKNKLTSAAKDSGFLGEDKEWLVQYCKRKLKTAHYNYFVFGHRHLPLNIKLSESSNYINLGDWISYFSYGVFQKDSFQIKTYSN
ncbi:MAG: UDP-2,3-diacylglucosamine diphosphatase [Tenacibaculum sp.]